MHRCMNEMNGKTQESNDCKQQLRLQKQENKSSKTCLWWDKIQCERVSEPPYVGLEKQARKHTSGSKPNYRDMPADVSVKRAEQWLAWRREQQPPNREVKQVQVHFKVKGLYSRRREYEATQPFNKTATSDSSSCTIMAGSTLQGAR